MEQSKHTSESQISLKVMLSTLLFVLCMLVAGWYHNLTSRTFFSEPQLGNPPTDVMNVDYSVPVEEKLLNPFKPREYIRIDGIPAQ